MTGHIVTAGLAPSKTLAPSTSLAPQAPVYSGGPITPHRLAMGIGAGGALVDVTSYVEFGNGITYTYGRDDQFRDAQPGTFTFTLNNLDGRFTPDNPASPLATKVSEGMVVCWQLGTRLVRATVLSVEIPADEATWNQLVVTCDDMLGTAARHDLTNIADDLSERGSRKLLWRLDEGDGAWSAAEASGDPLGAFTVTRSNPSSTTQAVTFGVQQVDGLPGTAVTVTAAPGETNWFGTQHGNTMPRANVTYPSRTDITKNYIPGFWNMWVYPGSTINLAVIPAFTIGPRMSDSIQIRCTPTSVSLKAGTNNTLVTHTYTAAEAIVPHYVSFASDLAWQTGPGYWAMWVYLYVDGIGQGSVQFQCVNTGWKVPATEPALVPVEVNVSVTNPSGSTNPDGSPKMLSGTVQRISHTVDGSGLEENALDNTLDGRRSVLDYIATELASAAYGPAGPLSDVRIGYPDVSGRSILDVYNDIVRTEQGHLFCSTAGSLTAPVETIQLRARDRPVTPKATFDVTAEADGLPAFIRDISNVAATVQVTGPSADVTVTDPSIAKAAGRYISTGLSETILATAAADLQLWGSDRLNRGRNVGIRVQTVTVDAMSTPTDRSSDLLGLVPGDRIRLAGTPNASLGFTSWDAWLLGASETHTFDGHRFQFKLSPTLAPSAVLDTDRFAADGDVILGNTYSATATSIVVNTISGNTISTDTPYTIQVDAEQMTVTAITSSTLTVVRGVNGTTAASHAVNAPVEISPTAVYAF